MILTYQKMGCPATQACLKHGAQACAHGFPAEVALGTSLPDTFASKAAAEQERSSLAQWIIIVRTWNLGFSMVFHIYIVL